MAEKYYVFAFIKRIGAGWHDGEILQYSKRLRELNWDHAESDLDEWNIEDVSIETPGYYRLRLYFDGDDEYALPWLTQAAPIFVLGQPIRNFFRAMFRPTPKDS